MEVKKPYVQMPKPDNDEAVRLLTDLVTTVRYMAPRSNGVNRAYHAAKEFLVKAGVIDIKCERIKNETKI